MKLKRPNNNLEKQIQLAVKGLNCPVHRKPATIKMESENEVVEVEACCVFFKQDVMQIGERIRKDFLYKVEKTKERLERERKSREEGKDR
ncbi:MAG: hypothetical protein Q8M29_12265 [Bacteroidota bacterium]|nr:hypothetical protein [Bacteroidota bacterium]